MIFQGFFVECNNYLIVNKTTAAVYVVGNLVIDQSWDFNQKVTGK